MAKSKGRYDRYLPRIFGLKDTQHRVKKNRVNRIRVVLKQFPEVVGRVRSSATKPMLLNLLRALEEEASVDEVQNIQECSSLMAETLRILSATSPRPAESQVQKDLC